MLVEWFGLLLHLHMQISLENLLTCFNRFVDMTFVPIYTTLVNHPTNPIFSFHEISQHASLRDPMVQKRQANSK